MKKILAIILGIMYSFSVAQNFTNTENYVYKKTHLSDPSDLTQKYVENIEYLDGLGRPKQMISIKSTPNGQDLVIPVVYDQFGRNTKSYLPIPISTSNAAIQNSVTENAVSAYYGVSNAFSEKELESSPLSRVFQSASPGEDWKMSSGHTIKHIYDANATADQVKRYDVTTNWDSVNKIYISSISQTTYYEENSLYKSTVKDEDNNEKIVFKDLYGHIVLIRKKDGNNNLDTYYVYDKYDHLTYVIPPLASISINITPTIINNLCYQYKYDDKRRVIEKKLPGKDWEFMVYDKQNRLVLNQDALLRSTNNNFTKRGWIFNKYDKFGRIVYTGFFSNTASRNSMQSAINNMTANPLNNESRSHTSFNLNGIDVYYTKNAFPTGSMTILSINYYDTYPIGTPIIPTQILGQNVLTQDSQNSSISTKSLPVASYIKNIEDDNWTKNYSWYDQKGRVIGTHSINHLGGYTQREFELDFSGTLRHVLTRHKRLGNDAEKVITETFTYDNQNRLKSHKHQIDNNTPEYLAQNEYNELSQLKTKKVGGKILGSGLQTVDYAYNIRGWMTQINDPNNLGSDLFGYKIKYNQVEGLQTPDVSDPTLKVLPKYNGNIAEVDWRIGNENDPLKRYGYVYDGVNRLSAGFYQNAINPSIREYYEKVTYDLNGNIKTMKRTAQRMGTTALLIDNLTYQYENSGLSNRLQKVSDVITTMWGFPYKATPTDISYDDNGNMTSFSDKGISSIKYNYLDLPKQITQNSINTNYFYRADGTKIKKSFDGFETDYLDGFQYTYWQDPYGNTANNGMKLSVIPTSEGYYDGFKNRYYYNYTDQLGNVRLSYSDPDNDGIVKGDGIKNCDSTPPGEPCMPGIIMGDIEEVTDYYPFGMMHKSSIFHDFSNPYQYKYQSQELQETGFYSFKWRNYMPDVGRFFNVDPLSEMYAYQSHYNFSENRVIDAREIEGLEADLLNDTDQVLTPASFGNASGGYDGAPQIHANAGYFGIAVTQGIQEVVLQGQNTSPYNSYNGLALGDTGRTVIGFVPFVGSGLDIYEGYRNGNWVQFGIGIGGLALDVATLGSGSLIKGGVKAIGTELVEGGIKKITREAADAEMRIISAEAKTIMGETKVVRGGTCLACQFENGSGVTVGSDGLLNGVSVNSLPGLSIEELAKGIPNGKIGTTTIEQIEAIGGKVVSSPTKNNPYHSTLSGITSEQAEKLFNPIIKNPNK